MTFSAFARLLAQLETTTSRSDMTQALSKLFAIVDGEELEQVCYLITGQLAPAYRGIVFNLAERSMIEILARVLGTSSTEVTENYKTVGDLGEVAYKLLPSKRSELTITQVYTQLWAAADEAGEGSQERRIVLMEKLLGKLDPLSAKYVVRIPLGKLRLGFSDATILDALSVLLTGDKSFRKILENAFNVTVDIGKIASRAKKGGVKSLVDVLPEPGTPIRPSLAERLPSAEKMLEKVGIPLAVEPKYDGFRAQVHVQGGKVTIFSRSLDNTTESFPELTEAVSHLKCKSAIFDGEAIAFDPVGKKFLAFQETVQRKRKHNIGVTSQKVPLKLFVFDILFLNGVSLLTTKFEDRRKILTSLIGKDSKNIGLTRQDVVTSASAIRDLVQKYLSEGLEGAMVKKLDAPYKAGGRGFHWVKYKKTTEEGVADTIDCVVMGVYKGKGKRTNFGAGAFLVGVVDGEVIKSVSKIGTGLTDDQWRELDRRTQKLKTTTQPDLFEVDKTLAPDVWCMPELVVEILADEITVSPIHKAGLALRFPRLVKFRDDKSYLQATSLTELTKLFDMQKVGQ